MASKKKPTLKSRIADFHRKRLKNYKTRLQRKQKRLEAKAEIQRNSTSLLWVWEFSKKAVLICFFFYVATQVYAMVTMWYTLDFTSLPNLIDRTAELTERCVFAYLIKAAFENVGKIIVSRKNSESTTIDENNDGPVG